MACRRRIIDAGDRSAGAPSLCASCWHRTSVLRPPLSFLLWTLTASTLVIRLGLRLADRRLDRWGVPGVGIAKGQVWRRSARDIPCVLGGSIGLLACNGVRSSDGSQRR